MEDKSTIKPDTDEKTIPQSDITAETRGGMVFRAVGFAGIASAFGAMIGFYFADRGMRWFPTMVDVLLLTVILSLIVMVASRFKEGSAIRVTAKGKRLRKRVIACLVMLLIAIIVHLSMFIMQQSSPLTDLTPEEFSEAFATDMDKFYEYDKALEGYLDLLESNSGMFADAAHILTPGEEKLLREVWAAMYDYAFSLDQVRLFYEDWYRFDPSRAQRAYHLRSFLLTYAAELSLFEKSTRMINLVSTNPNAVKFLDAPHEGTSLGANTFSTFREELQGNRDKLRVTGGRNYMLWLDKGLNCRAEAKALQVDSLWDKIERELELIDAMSTVKLAGVSMSSDLEVLKRSVRRVWYPAQKGVAEWMGNTRVRRIGKYLITAEQQAEMDKHLDPGDIMLSRKNWYLSNVGLPGFWPHAVLYVGAPDKLEGYFEDPEVLGYLKRLAGKEVTLVQYLAENYPQRWLRYTVGVKKEPHRVIEAVKDGVVMNPLSIACGDYMGVVRPRLGKLAKAQAIIEAFGHVDKPYDYNFDFATDHALVCTELVWRSYRPAENKEGLKFQLSEIAGRLTLPANEIVKQYAAEYGKADAQLDFVYFIDATEKDAKTFVAEEEDFRKSCERIKWDFALD